MTFGSFVTTADTNSSAINAGYIDDLWRTVMNHDELNEEVPSLERESEAQREPFQVRASKRWCLSSERWVSELGAQSGEKFASFYQRGHLIAGLRRGSLGYSRADSIRKRNICVETVAA